MDIKIGASVMGTSGKLGDVHQVIVDARTDRVTDLVVKHGSLFGGKERVIPLSHVSRVEGETVYVDLDENGMEGMSSFTGPVRDGDPDYVGTPGMDMDGSNRGNLVLDAMVATGSGAGLGTTGKPLGFPGGERLSPDMTQRPAIKEGMAVFSSDGEKVGEVGEFSVDAETGKLTQFQIKKGFLLKHGVDVPADWVQDLGSEGVVLTAVKGQIAELESRK